MRFSTKLRLDLPSEELDATAAIPSAAKADAPSENGPVVTDSVPSEGSTPNEAVDELPADADEDSEDSRGRLASHFDVARGSERERLVESTFSILDSFAEAFAACGVTNAVSLEVDEIPVFYDNAATEDDLGEMMREVDRNWRHVLKHEFEVLRMVMEHRDGGLHSVIDVTIQGTVELGEDEAELTVVATMDDLEPRDGESAPEYRERLLAWLADPGKLAAARTAFEEQVKGLLTALAEHAKAEAAAAPEVRMLVHVPSVPTLRNLGSTRFSEHQIRFRKNPAIPSSPAFYREPHSACYFNPFEPFANLLWLHQVSDEALSPAKWTRLVTLGGVEKDATPEAIGGAMDTEELSILCAPEAAQHFDAAPMLGDGDLAYALNALYDLI